MELTLQFSLEYHWQLRPQAAQEFLGGSGYCFFLSWPQSASTVIGGITIGSNIVN
jgi:hypothetical protein